MRNNTKIRIAFRFGITILFEKKSKIPIFCNENENKRTSIFDNALNRIVEQQIRTSENTSICWVHSRNWPVDVPFVNENSLQHYQKSAKSFVFFFEKKSKIKQQHQIEKYVFLKIYQSTQKSVCTNCSISRTANRENAAVISASSPNNSFSRRNKTKRLITSFFYTRTINRRRRRWWIVSTRHRYWLIGEIDGHRIDQQRRRSIWITSQLSLFANVVIAVRHSAFSRICAYWANDTLTSTNITDQITLSVFAWILTTHLSETILCYFQFVFSSYKLSFFSLTEFTQKLDMQLLFDEQRKPFRSLHVPFGATQTWPSVVQLRCEQQTCL